MKNIRHSKLTKSYSSGIALSMALASAIQVSAAPLEADGWIKVDRETVVAESVVNVEWAAEYPSTLPPKDKETVKVLTCTLVEVRVIGAAFGPSNKPYPVRGWVKSTSTGGWQQIFLGNQNTVDPQVVAWKKVLQAGETLDFEFQGSYDNKYDLSNPSTIGSWQPKINTTSSSPRPYNRMVLADDEVVPNFNPAHDQGDVHSHLKAYFEPGSKKLKLGPNDYIYLTELSPFDQGDSRTDMQDLVLLVTFTAVDCDADPDDIGTGGTSAGGSGDGGTSDEGKVKSNNGHGNNIDGVDSSNPGNSGSNKTDSDPNVDDERGGGGSNKNK